MRVPGIGGFSPVDTISWVRPTSPSELVFRQRTRPTEGQSAAPRTSTPAAAAAREARPHLDEAVHALANVADTLALEPHSEEAEPLSAEQTIADAYPGVRGGTITVNGHSINVTPGVTTIREVVAALDTIPGLFAAVDSVTGTIMVAGLMADKKLVISDSTGLLRALGLDSGINGTPNAADTTVSDARRGITGAVEKATEVSSAVGRVNDAMRKLASAPRELDHVKQAASSAVAKAVQSLNGTAAQAFRLDTTSTAVRLSVEPESLKTALRTDPGAISDFLKDGLQKPLQKAAEQLDEVGGVEASRSVVEKGNLSLRLPPVELMEAVLAHADRASLRKR